ncbi:ABC transporter permease [Thalassoroseus pseudoceratinae]|uniref:ABC transporter permease n=1 Tax=Thalassoroseus pseudoceratinae TaxID=2713176 RepID=UPI0014248E33|nr:ABC-2 family transporter protein [Thalassoroseus pseudoceratinae]
MHPHYGSVYWTFFKNSLLREMSFRGNFVITLITRAFWFVAQLALFEIIYGQVTTINDWTREQYYAFMATGMLINAIVETFFMPNCANFSELIRTGNLDFALLKPIDTQFLISFEKINIAMLGQIGLAIALLVYSIILMDQKGDLPQPIGVTEIVLYVLLIANGVAFFYSLMIILASTSIWLGRNQSLYDFWFYLTVFARYPRSIYGSGPNGDTPSNTANWTAGDVLQTSFTYVVPILLVVTIPARVLLSKAITPSWLTALAFGASIFGLIVSRWVFHRALKSYRSASS